MSVDLRDLENRSFDLVVIGGGINGAGVARDAAQRGLSVALFEQGDFADGTSSRSSKLVHGGIRYLEQAAFRLVHEACRERRTLLDLAPHLVRPLPFVLPIYEGDARGPMRIRLGMWLYDLMAAFRNTRRHRMLRREEVLSREPGLVSSGLRGGALYYDAKMDDARLCLATLRSAEEHGAILRNFVKVRDVVVENGRAVGVLVGPPGSSEGQLVRARVVVSTCGPWSDLMECLEPHRPAPRLRPTKGVHLLVPALTRSSGIVLSARRDGRVFFVVPHGELSIVGTTDTDYANRPEDVNVTAEDVSYLLEETRRVFPESKLLSSDVVSTYAGIRPLLDERDAGPTAVSREHRIMKTSIGAFILIGGKYTTYRAVAEEITNGVLRELGHRRVPCQTQSEPLPGGEEGTGWRAPAFERWQALGVAPKASARIVDGHGARSTELEALIADDPQLAAPLGDRSEALIGAEVVHAVRYEWCRRLKDLFRTRTGRLLQEGAGQEEWLPAAKHMSRLLGWHDSEVNRSVQELAEERERMSSWRRALPGEHSP